MTAPPQGHSNRPPALRVPCLTLASPPPWCPPSLPSQPLWPSLCARCFCAEPLWPQIALRPPSFSSLPPWMPAYSSSKVFLHRRRYHLRNRSPYLLLQKPVVDSAKVLPDNGRRWDLEMGSSERGRLMRVEVSAVVLTLRLQWRCWLTSADQSFPVTLMSHARTCLGTTNHFS